MKRWAAAVSILICALLLSMAAEPSSEERLARHRNLGKAFYENPTTQNEAVEEFRKALELAPNSARERLNYGLALLRAGKTAEGIAEIQKVQQQDPSLPHTWFNLGISFKKAGEHERAAEQFEQMVKLVPGDAISHYNLGALYKLVGKPDAAMAEFEQAARLDPTLAAPHFQLFNAYRTSGRPEDAKRELAIFQRLKKEQEGAAIPEDVEWNMFAEVYDIMEDKAAPEGPGKLAFTSRAAGAAQGVLAVDANSDGAAELLTWSAEGLALEPGGTIQGTTGVTSAAAGDFNNDGFPDLCVLTANGPALFVNEKGKFVRHDAPLAQGTFHQALWLDYDHDYDLDLFLLGPKPVLLRNAGPAGFEDRTADFPFAKGEAVAGTTFRVVADTKGFDLAVAYADRGGVLYRDQLQGRYKAEDLPLPPGVRALRSADLNNDGYFDLVYVTTDALSWSRNNKTQFEAPVKIGDVSAARDLTVADLDHRGLPAIVAGGTIWQSRAPGEFVRAEAAGVPEACASVAGADLNSDGLEDVACVSGDRLHVLKNATRTAKRNWIGVRLNGVKNLKLAPGAEVEVKAGTRYQKKQYDGIPLLFGVGPEQNVDTVRITWPNGLIQNEMKQPLGKVHSYQEAQRLSGSCPMIWTWNGRGFEYITDVLGVAPLGASSGDGEYFPVDHDEYIQIDSSALKAVNGRYDVRITEELSEVAYLDHLRLLAVDRPSDVAIYTNDKFKAPPFPEFRLFGVSRPIRPASARDDRGRDVLPQVLRKDRTYPTGFDRDLSGVAKLHYLDLNFGAAAKENRAILVLSGWVDWADGSTFLGIGQHRQGGLVPPHLQVKDENGRWVTAIADMGMPAGKPKTIVVDLTGKFASTSREIRIVTNLAVYWDEIFLSEETETPDARPMAIPLATAELRFRGFSPNKVHPQRLQPEHFTYAGAMPVSMWNPTPGLYTRYGDVKELAEAIDDKLIVMGSGDELRLAFNATALPPLRPGWKRDFLLHVDGWAKDRDPNTAFGQTTTPLPFHRMSRYPYGPDERFPDSAGHREWQEKYLTRPALRLMRPLSGD